MSAYGSSRVQGRDEAESANQNSQAAFCVRAARQKTAQPVGRAACMQKLAVCRTWKQMLDRQ